MGSGDPELVEAGGGVAVLAGAVAGGGEATMRTGALGRERCACLACLRPTAVAGAAVVVVPPDTDHRHRFFEW